MTGSLALSERWTVGRMLGQGSGGTVYAATAAGTGEPVALKVVPHLSAEAVANLKNEFRALADLRHPNLVELYELVIDDTTAYIAMELIEGKRLDAYLSQVVQGPESPDLDTISLPPGRTSDPSPGASSTGPVESQPRWPSPDPSLIRHLFGGIAAALLEIHSVGLVHRDLKHANVMVSSDGVAKIVDFGLALRSRGDASSGRGRVVGTIAFMAPEQLRGETVDSSIDLFALGVMLYRSLSGEYPYRAKGGAAVEERQSASRVRLSRLVPETPPDLCELVEKLLSPHPPDRPDASEVLRRLGVEGPHAIAPSGRADSFVGRGPERARVAEFVAASDVGPTRFLRIQGESGLGKSRLLSRLARDLGATPGTLVLAGHCRLEESIPFQGLDGIITDLAAHLLSLSERDVRSITHERDAPVVRLFPGLIRVPRLGDESGSAGEDDEATQREALRALRRLLTAVGESTTVVWLIDDAQWMDADSLRVLESLVGSADPPRFALITGERPDDTPATRRLNGLSRSLGASSVVHPLSPLAESEARELLRAAGIEGHEESAAVHEAGGHPLFLWEIADAMRARGGRVPASLSDALAQRIDAASADASALLVLLAVSHEALPQPVAEAALGRNLRAALRELVHGRLARRVSRIGGATRTEAPGGAHVPYHDRIEELVLERLGDAGAAPIHATLAQAWADAGESSEAQGVHWLGAGEPMRAKPLLERAATRAERLLAFERAARLRGLLVELAGGDAQETLDAYVRHAEALALAGRGPESGAAYDSAAAAATGLRRLELERLAASQFLTSGHVDEALERFSRILLAVGLSLPRLDSPWLLAQLALPPIAGLWGRRRTVPTAVAADVVFAISSGLGTVHPLLGRLLEIHHRRLARRAGDTPRQARALAIEAAYRVTQNHRNLARSEEEFDRARAMIGRDAAPGLLAYIDVLDATACWCAGEFRKVLLRLERAQPSLSANPGELRWERSLAEAIRLDAMLNLGRWREMAQRAREHVVEARQRGDLYVETTFTLRFGSMAAALDDAPDRGLDGLAVMERWSRSGFHFQHHVELHNRPELLLYAGRPLDALAYLTERWPLLRKSRLLAAQMLRVSQLEMRGRVRVGAALASTGAVRTGLLKAANGDAASLRRVGSKWSLVHEAQIAGGVLAARGDPSGAAARWRLGAERADRHGMALHAAVLELAAAAVERSRLPTQALDVLDAEGARAPAKLCHMICPGAPYEAAFTREGS